MLDDTTKSKLEIKGEVLKSIINDLNLDRASIVDGIVADSSKRNQMTYVYNLESLVRQLINYQTMLERNDTLP